MASEYGKVIVGESIEDPEAGTQPLLVAEVIGVEATTSPAPPTPPPVTYTYARPPPRVVQPPHRPGGRYYHGGGYGTNAPVYPPPRFGGPPPPPHGPAPYGPEPGEMCARVGCLFSWIPIVGIITFAVNCDAEFYSRRAFWARTSLGIAIVVLIFNLLFWPMYYA